MGSRKCIRHSGRTHGVGEIRNLRPTAHPLAKLHGVAHLCATGHCQEEPFMKGLEKKKETKKKPQKTLKEKRAEKHAKKSSQA